MPSDRIRLSVAEAREHSERAMRSIGYDAEVPSGNNRERGLLERTLGHVGKKVLDNPRILISCDGQEFDYLLR